jgi:hypothetical protein
MKKVIETVYYIYDIKTNKQIPYEMYFTKERAEKRIARSKGTKYYKEATRETEYYETAEEWYNELNATTAINWNPTVWG